MTMETVTQNNQLRFSQIASGVLKEQPGGSAKNYIEATSKLLTDRPETPVDAVFFFGRSYMDAEKRGLFQLAADYVLHGQAKCIIIPGTEGERFNDPTPRAANPGKTLWTHRLVGMGVPKEKIIHSKPGFHTKAEGDAFLDEAKNRGWERVVAIANPHQILRATLGLIRTINTKGMGTIIYSDCPANTDWEKRVKGSQGQELKPRSEHILDEFKRVEIYQQKGDLASYEELYEYLKQRGGAT